MSQHNRLELSGIVKSFDGSIAVNDVDLTIPKGQFLSLLGPSGCGKSTLLSIITGLSRPDSGEVRVDGIVVNDVPPQHRRLGLVFQDYAVFSRLTVRENLAFGLKAQGVKRAVREQRIASIAHTLGLEALLPKYGASLNMSEMQRVALARVLVTEPDILLLDEPMSNLDAALRLSLRTDLKRIQTNLQQTVLYVTHDQAEAMAMSDQIAVMRAGKIQQVGSPETIYHRPATRFVAEFVGETPMNIVPCTLMRDAGGVSVTTALHGPIALGDVDAQPGDYLLGIRPHDLALVRQHEPGGAPATVRYIENLGAEHIAYLQYGSELLAIAIRPHSLRDGEQVFVALPAQQLHLIRPADGHILRPNTCGATQ